MNTVRFRFGFLVGLALLLLPGLTPAALGQVPLINQPLVPDSAAPGGATFTLTVNGTGFASQSAVEWNGTALFTLVDSDAQLTATVPASFITSPGTASITVVTPGAPASNVIPFPVATAESAVMFGHNDLTPSPVMAGFIAGDFNGDGIADLAVGAATTNSQIGIEVLLGNGDGSFRAPVTTSTAYISTFATGDFNGDGKLDLIAQGPATDSNSMVQIFLGNGDGTFTPGTVFSPPKYVSDIFVGDFNGDGKLDFGVVTNYILSDYVSIYLGNGDGTFQSPQATNYDVDSFYNATVGDFNKDGKLDLATATWLSTGDFGMEILLGNGDGTFQSPVGYTTSLSGINSVAAADFNNDGKLDLVLSGDVNQVAVLLGNGNGTFQNPAYYSTGTGSTSLGVGDFNNDGKTDLAVLDANSGGAGSVSILLGNGDGTFQGPSNFSEETSAFALTLGDFNNDGRLDLAVINNPENVTNTLALLIQNGVALTPGSLTFSNEDVGSTSPSQPVTLTNDGTVALAISSISLTGSDSGDFGQTNACGTTLAVGASCTINVTFTPTTTGTLTATLSVTDSGPSSPQTVSLTGTGVTPLVSFSPTSLSFPIQLIGTISAPQNITLTDTGAGPLDITSITASAGFTESNTCGSMVAPGASCTISVEFAPTQGGVQTGSIQVTDNAPGSPQSVPLTGTGTVVQVSPLGISFGGQVVGSTSAPVPVTLTNKGSSPLTINSISLSGANTGDFAQTNNCGSSLAGGASCTINVTFTPTMVGARSATLMISDNDPSSPQMVSLSGNGEVTGPNVTLAPTSLTLRVLAGSVSAAGFVTLTNNGSATVTISSIVASAGFGQTNTCGSSVPPLGNCTITITFMPTHGGAITGTLTITDNAPGSPQTVNLTGIEIAVANTPTLNVDFFGDGKADIGVWWPPTGTWSILSNNGGSNLTQVWGEPGDVTVPGDYDGDGKDDFAVWRPSNGTWYIIPSGDPTSPITTAWGLPDDVPVQGDYDGDGKTDVAVWRPSNGTFYVILSSTGKTVSQQWGESGDVPATGDYDGDGKADYAIFRPSNGTWYYIASSNGKTVTTAFGLPGDIPVEGDYDGDGETDLAVWRSSTAIFYVLYSSTGETVSQAWGLPGDVPVIGDYDGDQKNDYAVWRPSNETWYIVNSSSGRTTIAAWGVAGDVPTSHLASIFCRDRHIANYDGDRKTDVGVWRPSNATYYVIDSTTGKSVTQQWGENGDEIVPGDYDGDGKTDYAVWRRSNGTWYVLYSSSGKTASQQLGVSGDIPVPGDYDGDGKTDYAVWRPSNGTWYVILSSTGKMVTEPWGLSTDIPVPADYDGDGRTDYAIWRPSTGTWYVVASSTGKTITKQWGGNGDVPVPGDYDGDTKADFTIFRPSTGTWYTLESSNGKTVTTVFGENGDIPVAKDYDGDEKTDVAVWRPSTATWYILQSSNGKATSTVWGLSTDVPVNKPTGQ